MIPGNDPSDDALEARKIRKFDLTGKVCLADDEIRTTSPRLGGDFVEAAG
jgi:hypothetical protein